MGYMERYEEWLKRLPEDHPFHAELIAIKDNDAEIKDRFYKEIEFGTAGLRGIFGAGTNRMNEFTVGRATQGIANYILSSGEDVNRGFVPGRKRDQGVPVPFASPYARAVFCHQKFRGTGRHQHDSQPQSEGIQRI